MEPERNKACSVERDDLHILVGSVHSYVNQGETMIPLSVIFSHFSVFSLWGVGGVRNPLESGHTLLLWCGFKFCFTHRNILKHQP